MALDTWWAFQDVSPAFETLSRAPTDESLITNMPILRVIRCLMYGKVRSLQRVNETRK